LRRGDRERVEVVGTAVAAARRVVIVMRADERAGQRAGRDVLDRILLAVARLGSGRHRRARRVAVLVGVAVAIVIDAVGARRAAGAARAVVGLVVVVGRSAAGIVGIVELAVAVVVDAVATHRLRAHHVGAAERDAAYEPGAALARRRAHRAFAL